jgi:membrane fusion protein (multidrug efflux system)
MADTTASPGEPRDSNGNGKAQRLRRLRLPLMIGGVVVVLAIAAFVWLTGGRYESTDDAYVRVAGVDISTNVSGRVVEVDVHENQRVKAGDVLFRLDTQPFEIAAEQANAELANAALKIQSTQADYQEKLVALKTAETTAHFREVDRKREQGLLAAGAVSQAEYDAAALAAASATQQIAQVKQQIASLAAQLGGDARGGVAGHPEVRQAKAALDRARLNEDYGVIRAPQSGTVTKVEQLQVGDYVNASTPVFHLVADRMWIEADFKENQLHHMRVGQAATVEVDAYPGHTFQARVQSIAPGTDQTFSLLPSENSSGNWVKVVQRLPVRLVFDKAPDIALQGGISAKVKVDTGYSRMGGGHPR